MMYIRNSRRMVRVPIARRRRRNLIEAATGVRNE